jgi:hypothetical protein
MNKRNTNYLMKRFKGFFKHKDNLRASLMAFGFGPDGWYPIIKKLCIDIEKELEKPENKELRKDFEVIQVKEKFGELRFYTNFGNERIFDLIGAAEEESHKVCANCGTRTEDIYKPFEKKGQIKRLRNKTGGTVTYYGKGGQVKCRKCGYLRIY